MNIKRNLVDKKNKSGTDLAVTFEFLLINTFQLALAQLGNRMTDTIDRLELLITDSPTEARIRAMNASASLIKLDKENQVELLQLLLHFHLAFIRALSFSP